MRKYFYFVDARGKLFLEETKIKNFATCFKDKSFLNRFFRGLKENTTSLHPEYFFVYKCMKELNFLKCEDKPIVFYDLIEEKLIYAGDLKVKFEPKNLFLNPKNSRLYQRVDLGEYGLLSENIMMNLNIDCENNDHILHYNSEKYKLTILNEE
eukprot:gene1269-11356_t